MTTGLLLAEALLTTAPWQTFEFRDGGKPWTFSAADADVASGGWVTVDFTAAWSNIVKERPNYAWSGVVFAAKAEDEAGKRLHLKTVNLGAGSRAETTSRMRFLLPKRSRKFNISFGPQFAKGKFTLRNVTVSLNAVDPSHPSIEYKGKSYEYDERGKPPAEAATLPPGETLGLFHVASPRMTFDRFPPERGTLTNRFSATAAPGEVANVFVGLYAAEDANVTAVPGSFARRRGPFGVFSTELPSPQVFRAHNRPNTAGRGQTYWIDLADFRYGDPRFDMGMLYMVCVLCPEEDLAQRLFHLSHAQMVQVWNVFVKTYYGPDADPVTVGREIAPFSALYMIHFANRESMNPAWRAHIENTLLK